MANYSAAKDKRNISGKSKVFPGSLEPGKTLDSVIETIDRMDRRRTTTR